MHRSAVLLVLCVAFLAPGSLRSATPPQSPGAERRAPRAPDPRHPGIAIDERLAADHGLRVGDRVVVAARPGAAAAGDTANVVAIVRRGADPSEVARSEYRVRMHLGQLQRVAGYGDRVDRFAVATRDGASTARVVGAVNAAAFGFRAHRSADVAVGTSRTFQVVERFHRAIGVITVVASAAFLLCILLLKVEERRRDVAALRLMGISRRTVVSALVLEASLVALLGSAIGLAVGWTGTLAINWYYQGVYRTPLAFALVTPAVAAFAVALSLLLGVGAGLVAAVRLARTPPLALFGR
jgi:putative ABC transport system permease protein